MDDHPNHPEYHPDYVLNVMEPLARGEGVAAFVVDTGDGDRVVLYASHAMTARAFEIATDERDFVRAAQAIAIQREARAEAAGHGYTALVS